MSYFSYKDKQCFYKEYGEGEPLIFLHGNMASSKMFEMVLPLYSRHFKVILMDFLGNGKSDRVERFPADLWHSQAMQALSLLEHLDFGKVSFHFRTLSL